MKKRTWKCGFGLGLALRRGSGTRIPRLLPTTLVIHILIWISCGVSPALEPPMELRKSRLFVVYSSTLFSHVNQNDALAALKVWVQSIGRDRGFLLETEAFACDSVEEADSRIRTDSADLLILNPLEYLQSSQTGKVDLEFIAGHQEKEDTDDYVLVKRREANPAGLKGLHGKSVVFHKTGANWGRLWMDVALGEAGLGSASDFFGANTEAAKPASVVLPVFFGKQDAGVVKRSSLRTMAEMNPQLATQLQIVTNSASLPELVVCVHKSFQVFHDDLVQGLAKLHTEPKGQQVLLLFGLAKLERFQPELLRAARELVGKHAKLILAPSRAVAASPSGEQKP